MIARLFFLSLLTPLLASCATLKAPDTPVTMRLSPVFPVGTAPLRERSFAVAPVLARGLAARTRYVYFEAGNPGEVHQAATLFWEEPPAQVIERGIVAGLRARYAPVTGPGVAAAADWRILATVTRFEELGGPQTVAKVGFDAEILHQGKLERSGTYCGQASITGSSPTNRTQAFETAIEQAVDRLVQDTAVAAAPRATC